VDVLTDLDGMDEDDEEDTSKQYFSEEDPQHREVPHPAAALIGSENGDLLKKLISNIQNNHSLRNADIRATFKLENIKCEKDLQPVKNLQNALAALFYTNYRMKDVTNYFGLWRELALER
jgi:hypothetical protein